MARGGMAAVVTAALLGAAVGELAVADGIRALKRWPGTVAATKLNVRSGPGQNYEIVNTLEQGDEVIVVEQVRGWVRLEREFDSWIHRRFVSLPENFMEPLFGDAENEFLDWAGGTGYFQEISVEASGRVAVILMPELYADPAAAREAAQAAACAYREQVGPDGAASVVIWAQQGPAAGLVDEVACPD